MRLLTGGAGFMFGTLMGFLIQGLIQTYITFDGKLSSWWSKIVTGFLLFAFIAFPRKTARRPERWRNAMKSNLVVIPPGRDHSNQAEVTRTIGIDIIVDRYPEGTSLPREAELTAMFDVSRTVLRESVKTLSAKGPLNSKAGVGARVRERSAWNMFDSDVVGWHLEVGIDKRFLRDLTDIRLAVEPRAAALAAERRADDAIAILRDSIVKLRSFASDSIEFADADLRLHLDVATFSANPFMRSIGAVIEAALRASFRLSAPTEKTERAITIAAHERIVDAIADRDAEAAAAAMTNVIFNGLRRHGAAG
jgi:DNA-binding FadR family transcriptional regulator